MFPGKQDENHGIGNLDPRSFKASNKTAPDDQKELFCRKIKKSTLYNFWKEKTSFKKFLQQKFVKFWCKDFRENFLCYVCFGDCKIGKISNFLLFCNFEKQLQRVSKKKRPFQCNYPINCLFVGRKKHTHHTHTRTYTHAYTQTHTNTHTHTF